MAQDINAETAAPIEETANPIEDKKEPETSGFKPITSQDELDRIIKKRLDRERKKIETIPEQKPNDDHSSELLEQISALKNQLSESQKKVAKYETDSVKNRIAAEYGIPAKFASRLAGETEEEIKADAEIFAEPFRTKWPQKDHSNDGASKDAAWIDLARKL